MKQTAYIAVATLCLVLAACDEPPKRSDQGATPAAISEASTPPFPHPVSLPGEKWAVYTVKAYRALEPERDYNPWTKHYALYLGYQMTLESTAVRLRLTCTQVGPPDDPHPDCGQGALLPNDKLWTREGASGEDLWVYSIRKPSSGGLEATFWHVDSREAK